jgi:serine/threonine protein kinase
LDAQRWAQLEELFHRVGECAPSQRTRVLEECGNGDMELRSTVERLLASAERAAHNLQAAVNVGLDAVAFPLVGETISHYRILAGIDTGGMGSVYRAEDIKLGRQVALKFLAEEFAKDPAALSRFEREARAASALEHPNICPIYEFGEHAGQPFLVMQLLEGRTLRELISQNGQARPPFAIPELLDLALQIASAMDAAHRHGIIHRDIKPANIFITTEGQAKVLDFGLVKPAHGEAAEPESYLPVGSSGEADERRRFTQRLSGREVFLSRTGVAIGTSAYMSPEQARGEKVDARTDIFSFGLVLYEMATGHRAFAGATEPVLHDAIFRQSPAPARQHNPALPAHFEAIVDKALERDRNTRYQTAADLRADLEDVKQATERGKVSRLRVFASSALVALLIAAGVALWFARRIPSPVMSADIKFRPLTLNSYENPVTSGAISPSGKYLAYVDSQGMHIKDIDSGESRFLTLPQDVSDKDVTWEIIGAGWFPDNLRFVANQHPPGFQLGWSSQTTSIWVFSRTNAAPRKLREHAMAWSVAPDGSLISFGTNHGRLGERENWQMTADGQHAHKMFETDEDTSVHGFYWSPDGQRGLYVKTDSSGDSLLTRNRAGGSPVTVPTPKRFEQSFGDMLRSDLAWLPQGRVIYQMADDVSGQLALEGTCNPWTTRLDPKTGEPLGKPQPLAHWPGFCYGSANATIDGRRLALLRVTGVGTAYVADLQAGGTRIGTPRHFTLEREDEFVDGWTTDSRTLIVGVNRDDGYGLYTQDLNSSTREPLAPAVAGAWLAEAVASPDGKWVIALVWPIEGGPTPANPDAPLSLVRIPITGGSPQTILHVTRSGPFSCSHPPANVCVTAEQTADGRQMIVTEFDVVHGRGRELTRVDLDRKIDFSENPLAAISPDGSRLAVARSPDGPIEIRSLRGQPTFTLPANRLDQLWNLTWAPDGKGLFVARHVQSGTALLHVDLHGESSQLWKSVGPRGYGAPSPDGRHLAICDSQQDANMWMIENF